MAKPELDQNHDHLGSRDTSFRALRALRNFRAEITGIENCILALIRRIEVEQNSQPKTT